MHFCFRIIGIDRAICEKLFVLKARPYRSRFTLSFLRYCSVFKEAFPLFARCSTQSFVTFFLASNTYRKVTSYGNHLELFCFVVNIEITLFVFRTSMEMRKRFFSLHALLAVPSNSAGTKSSFMTFRKVISSCCLRENKLTLNAGS